MRRRSGAAVLMRRLSPLCAVFLTVFLAGCMVAWPPPWPTEVSEDGDGNPLLILEPLDVWDDGNSQGPKHLHETEVDELTLWFRTRPAETFEQAWIRAGLFWHPKLKTMMLPLVILGPPVTVREVRLYSAGGREKLPPATDFDFTPGTRTFDGEVSSTVVGITRAQLRTMAFGKDVYVEIVTNRGTLRGNMAATPADSERERRNVVRYHFANFYNRLPAK